MKDTAVICSKETNSLRFARMLCIELRRAGFDAELYPDPPEPPSSERIVCDADADLNFDPAARYSPEKLVLYTRSPGPAERMCRVLARPFATEELTEALRGLETKNSGMGSTGPALEFDRETLKVRMAEKEVSLTPLEARLLSLLLEHSGEVLDRGSIARSLWEGDGWDGGTNRIDVYIRYLRKKLETLSDRRIIRTVRGRGYEITP